MSRSIFVIHHYDASVCVFFTFSKNPKKYVLGGVGTQADRRSHNPPTIQVALCQAKLTANTTAIPNTNTPTMKGNIISPSFLTALNHLFIFKWFRCCRGVLITLTPLLLAFQILLYGRLLL